MGWPLVRLDSLYNIARGGSPRPIKDFITDDPEGINWIKIGDATASGKYIYTTKQKIKPEGIQRSRLVKENDFLLSNSMSFGRPYIMGTTGCIHDGWLVLSAKDKQVDQDFLYHLLGSPFVFLQFDSLAAGSTVRNLNIDLVSGVKIPLIPIPEQQRIVAILDQAFADIEKARANAEKNLKNARELFDSYLNQVFSQRGEGWFEEVLGRVCDVRDGTHDSPKYVDEGIPFITQKNIRTDGLSFEKTKFISETDHMKFYKRSNVTHGDILISMIGANRGMACVVDDHRIFSIKNVGLIKKALNINPLYLLFYLKSHTAKKYIESESRGGAQPFIGLTKLRAFPVLLASPEEQEEVVSKLTLIEARTENLVLIYETKLKSLEELKKSLLQKAFSGELTKTEDMVA